MGEGNVSSAVGEGFFAQRRALFDEPGRQDGEDHFAHSPGPHVGVVFVDVSNVVEEGLVFPASAVFDDEGRLCPGVGLQIPCECEHFGSAVKALELFDAVVDVSPAAGEFACEVDR